MTRLYAITAVVLVTALLGVMGVYVLRGQSDDRFAQCRSSQIAGGKAAIGGAFTLTNHLGQTVTEKDVIIKPTLLYFGYTFCPDVCPMDTARNAETIDLLDAQGLDVTPVFISIDPARDTPESLADFVTYTHDKMIGLTGTEEQVKAASKAYKSFYRKASDDEHYLMDHSTFTYLVFPEHGFVEFFTRGQSAGEMAKSVACYVNAS